jgi:hypothetical protein
MRRCACTFPVTCARLSLHGPTSQVTAFALSHDSSRNISNSPGFRPDQDIARNYHCMCGVVWTCWYCSLRSGRVMCSPRPGRSAAACSASRGRAHLPVSAAIQSLRFTLNTRTIGRRALGQMLRLLLCPKLPAPRPLPPAGLARRLADGSMQLHTCKKPATTGSRNSSSTPRAHGHAANPRTRTRQAEVPSSH